VPQRELDVVRHLVRDLDQVAVIDVAVLNEHPATAWVVVERLVFAPVDVAVFGLACDRAEAYHFASFDVFDLPV